MGHRPLVLLEKGEKRKGTSLQLHIAGSGQYCRNYQLPLFEKKNEFESLEEAVKS